MQAYDNGFGHTHMLFPPLLLLLGLGFIVVIAPYKARSPKDYAPYRGTLPQPDRSESMGKRVCSSPAPIWR